MFVAAMSRRSGFDNHIITDLDIPERNDILSDDESPIPYEGEGECVVWAGREWQETNQDQKNYLDERKMWRKLKKLFRVLDTNGNNALERVEFRSALNSRASMMGHGFEKIKGDEPLDFSDDQMEQVFKMINLENDGKLDAEELWNFVRPEGRIEAIREHIRHKFRRAILNPSSSVSGHFTDHFRLTFEVTLEKEDAKKLSEHLLPGRSFESCYAAWGIESVNKHLRVPIGSILSFVDNISVEKKESKWIRVLIGSKVKPFTVKFTNRHALTASQIANMPEVEKKYDKDEMEEIREKEKEETDRDSRRKNEYPPGHNKHTPDQDKRPIAYYIHRTMEDETFSPLSLAIVTLVMILIFISTFSYIAETIPYFKNSKILELLETVVSLAFSVEYGIRIVVSKNMFNYFFDAMNAVDFMAVVPFWIQIITKSSGGAFFKVVRVIRLARVVRLMKSPHLRAYMNIFAETLASSVESLGLLMAVLFLCVLFASLTYVVESGTDYYYGKCDDFTQYSTCALFEDKSNLEESADVLAVSESPLEELASCIEFCQGFQQTSCCQYQQDGQRCSLWRQGQKTSIDALPENVENSGYWSTLCREETYLARRDDAESPFISIPAAIWWCVVTMTTVGYGDIYPIEPLGRALGIMCMLIGLLVIALPVIIIGNDFQKANEKHQRRSEREREEAKAKFELKNDEKLMIEHFFNEVNLFFQRQYEKKKENNKYKPEETKYDYGPVKFTEDDETIFYECGLKTKERVLEVLRSHRGYNYIPISSSRPSRNLGEEGSSIKQYRRFALWSIYGPFEQKRKKESPMAGSRTSR